MSRALFGTDGVRGLAGEFPLDQAGTVKIGRAVGTYFAKQGESVVLGWDPRASSKTIVDNLVNGLNAVGVNVVLVGVLPTPGLAYITREHAEFVAGIMVTASHNPRQYNGVKVFNSEGGKLTDETETKLNTLIVEGVDDRETGNVTTNVSLVADYEDFLVNSVGEFKLKGMRIVLDSANGAASSIAEKVFSRLGAEVKPIFDKPDGVNINDGCGATNVDALSREVLAGHHSMGVALDGDADRVVLIDELGRALNGDYIIYILAKSAHLGGVVLTVMSNLGTENSLKENGVQVTRVQVGDRYVLDGLKSTGYAVGGEQAGHIIISDLLATGDGLLAAVQTVKAVVDSGKTLVQWRDEVKMLPQALVNIPLHDKALLDLPEVKNFLEKQMSKLGDAGRLLIRPSGTEPLARVMVEAPNAQNIADDIASQLGQLIQQAPKKEVS